MLSVYQRACVGRRLHAGQMKMLHHHPHFLNTSQSERVEHCQQHPVAASFSLYLIVLFFFFEGADGVSKVKGVIDPE